VLNVPWGVFMEGNDNVWIGNFLLLRARANQKRHHIVAKPDMFVHVHGWRHLDAYRCGDRPSRQHLRR
jgi:hypothetical protein